MVIPEAGTKNTIPSKCIFDNLSIIHSVSWRDLSFHLVLFSRSDIRKRSTNESGRSSGVSTDQLLAKGLGLACEIAHNELVA